MRRIEDVDRDGFNLEASRTRQPVSCLESRHEVRFRNVVLVLDDHSCVPSGDNPVLAREAAFLIPAAMVEDDLPLKGATLRADHLRLFDAGLVDRDGVGRAVEPLEIETRAD
ncbi:MAG: hypothetical protein OXL68_02415 [Paracoccaceae bacterium]|nr:hypothetical protein [Paracoccaceae bacterium]